MIHCPDSSKQMTNQWKKSPCDTPFSPMPQFMQSGQRFLIVATTFGHYLLITSFSSIPSIIAVKTLLHHLLHHRRSNPFLPYSFNRTSLLPSLSLASLTLFHNDLPHQQNFFTISISDFDIVTSFFIITQSLN